MHILPFIARDNDKASHRCWSDYWNATPSSVWYQLTAALPLIKVRLKESFNRIESVYLCVICLLIRSLRTRRRRRLAFPPLSDAIDIETEKCGLRYFIPCKHLCSINGWLQLASLTASWLLFNKHVDLHRMPTILGGLVLPGFSIISSNI